MIQKALKPYSVFTDSSGNLDGTCFSGEKVPYAGELVVLKTVKREAAQKAYEVLSGIEGLLVLPITTCSLEKDRERVERLAQLQGQSK